MDYLILWFDGDRGRAGNVTLNCHELAGPEIAMLSGFADGRWMCWRPGEDSFEDLF